MLKKCNNLIKQSKRKHLKDMWKKEVTGLNEKFDKKAKDIKDDEIINGSNV